ncbi:hypothetical protein HY449_02025 [Candidatus Pacearchaeota archaeon]|nr:hypothetical protein [Candidatus Pacearchaeota archaeon]
MGTIINWLIFIAIATGCLSIVNFVSFYKQNKNLIGLRDSKKISSNQYESLKYQNLSNFVQISSLTLVSFLMFVTITTSIFGILSNENLSNQNRGLLKQTSSSNWADIEIDFRYPEYSNKSEVYAEYLADPDKEWGISLVVINSGKVNTGHFRVDYMNDKFLFAHLDPETDINISSQEGKYIYLRIKQDYCGKGSEGSCDASKLPEGNYDLKLNFTCDFCSKDERKYQFTVPLCIIHKNNSICR